MLEKVLVMEVKQAYAIAMKSGGEMVRIRRKDGMQVGDKIYILPEDLYKEQSAAKTIPFPQKSRRIIRNLASVAAVLVMIIGLVLYSGPATVYAVASFDGQQDLQLKLDSSCRILSGSSSRISEEEIRQLQGQKLSDVGEQLCRLMGDGPVLIGYASYHCNTERDTQAEQQLREMFSDHIILCLLGNGEDIDQADESMESLGFYLAGEVIADHHIEKLADLLEDYAERYESEDDKDGDDSHLNDMDFDQLLDEIRQNPEYARNENVLEILADKIEQLHEEHKENEWDSEDENDQDEDSDSDPAQTEADDDDAEDNEDLHDSETDDEEEDSD